MLNIRLATALAALVLACPLSASRAQEPDTLGPLIGIWENETLLRSLASGPLVVRREGNRVHATFAGARAEARHGREEIRLAFGALGNFRGTITQDGRSIRGFWLQPSAGLPARSNPGGASQPFATPLLLVRTARNAWRGRVEPLEDRMTLYLRIFRNDRGEALGAFRNPEWNSNGGASQFRVSRAEDRVRFSIQLDGGERSHDATFLPNPDRLRILWPDIGRTIELTRRDPATVATFFPRPPSAPLYSYRMPESGADGWRTASAREVAMDEAALSRLVRRIAASDPSARPATLMHSILVARRGRLVLDEYFYGHTRDTLHDIRSIGKTFGSVMLGAAMMEGARLSPDMPIYALLGREGHVANPDPRKDAITLAHLMTHASGLACNENDDESPGNEDVMQRQSIQPDWWRYALDLPMAHDPGRRYAYCSADYNLVGAALTETTRTWLPALFDRLIARPLQFGRYSWNLMPTGEGYLGGGAFVRPRDLLKIGQVYLDGGAWQGRRIVTPEWVRTSTAAEMEITEATTGLDAQTFANSSTRGADGFGWHSYPLNSGGRAYRSYEANGNGGQLLVVVPELELVVVFTGGNYGQGGVWTRWRQDIIGGEIIPAILDQH